MNKATVKANGPILAGALCLCLALAGCATSKPAAVKGGLDTTISEIDLVALPVAVNLESKPGVDGVAVKIYAVDIKHPKTQPINGGVLEVFMFDGINRESPPDTNHCRHIWSYPGGELPVYSFTTAVGVGYSLPLGWGADRPRGDNLTLLARYRPSDGPVIYSAPSYIAMPVSPLPAPSLPEKK